MSKLKPLGFVIATGLRPFVSETASACFSMPSPSLGTQPDDVPYAITVVISEKVISTTVCEAST